MKKALCAVAMLSLSLWGAEAQDKSLEDLEKENKLLEMKLKNEKLKKEIEDTQKSDEEKKAEAIATAKQIVEELTKKPSKDEKRSGRIWGFGVGGMDITSNKWTGTYTGSYINPKPVYSEENELLFLIDTQLGGMTMWNRYFGVQYYANVDLAFNFDFTAYSFVTTFNTDAILNAYNSDSFGFGFLAGLGLGARIDYASGGVFAYDVDARANLGVRMIFGSSHALDFMIRIPFVDTYATSNLKENVSFSARLTLGTF